MIHNTPQIQFLLLIFLSTVIVLGYAVFGVYITCATSTVSVVSYAHALLRTVCTYRLCTYACTEPFFSLIYIFGATMPFNSSNIKLSPHQS